MKKSSHPTRRTICQGAAAGLLLPLLRSGRTQAAAPKRLIVFHTPNGIEHIRTLPPSLQQQRADFTIVEGPDWKSAAREIVTADDDHGKGAFASLTANLRADAKPAGPSLDQFLVNALKPDTKFPSIELGVLAFGWGGDHVNARADGSPIPAESKPRAAFDRLFAGVVPPPAGTPIPAGPSPAELLRQRRKSILDHVAAELQSVRPTLPVDERAKVDRHLEALRALEKRLTAAPPALGATPAGVQGFAGLSARIDQAKIPPWSPDYPVHYPLAAGIMTDMTVLALSSGVTRFATLRYSGKVSNIRHTWIGSGRGHHDLAHDPTGGAEEFRKVTHWYGDQFAALLQKLKAVPDGAGTLLDSSVVLWTSDMANGNHGFKNGTWIVAGRAGGALKPGGTVTAPGTSQNDLYLSLCHAMGAQTAKFGNPAACAGPLPGLG